MKRCKIMIHEVLPEEILLGIFSRLPMRPISRCRLVCKHWFNLLNNPVFINMFNSQAILNQNNPHHHPDCLVLCDSYSNILHLLDYPQNYASTLFSTPVHCHFRPNPNSLKIVASVNGLMCLLSTGYENCMPVRYTYYVFNPITREVLNNIPKATVPSKTSNFSPSGFVFDAVTNTYKVVHTWNYGDDSNFITTIEIYTLGCSERSWKRLLLLPRIRFHLEQSQVFLHGALHWRIAPSESIGAVEIGNGNFRTFKGPVSDYYGSLFVVRERLCFAETENRGRYIDLWIMNEYGVESSWSRQHTIQKEILGALGRKPFDMVTVTRNGPVLLIGEQHQGYYDLEKNEFQPIQIANSYSRSSDLNAVLHHSSLISPNSTQARIKSIPRRSTRKKRCIKAPYTSRCI